MLFPRLHDFTLQRTRIHFSWSDNLGQVDAALVSREKMLVVSFNSSKLSLI